MLEEEKAIAEISSKFLSRLKVERMFGKSTRKGCITASSIAY